MHVVVNGSSREIPEIVPRAEHATRAVATGDAIEIVHFVGGG
jgi:thiamine biosynthesis protein ThiS